MEEDEIKRLLTRIGERDEQAFIRLHLQFAKKVQGFVLRGMFDPDEHLAEEIVSDTFYAVWQRPQGFNGKCRFETWLFSIARNKLLLALREKKKLWKRLVALWEERNIFPFAIEFSADSDSEEAPCRATAEEENNNNVLEWISAKQERESVIRCVEKLTPDQQQCLYLAFNEDMSQSEIADAMGIPLGTVKGRLRAAYEKIRGCLEKVHKTYPAQTQEI